MTYDKPEDEYEPTEEEWAMWQEPDAPTPPIHCPKCGRRTWIYSNVAGFMLASCAGCRIDWYGDEARQWPEDWQATPQEEAANLADLILDGGLPYGLDAYESSAYAMQWGM